MLLPLLANLDFAGGGAPAPTPTPDRGKSAGKGRKPKWWEGEWLTPGVDAYIEPKDIPLRPKVERAKKKLVRLKPAKVDTAYRRALGKANALLRSVSALEDQAQRAVRAKDLNAALAKVTKRYRELNAKLGEIEHAIQEHEERAAYRRKIVADDNEILKALLEIL